MYELFVIVVQFCFAYPKSKPSIAGQSTDQMTTPDEFIDYGRDKIQSMNRKMIKDDQKRVFIGEGVENKSINETSLRVDDGVDSLSPSSQPTSSSSNSPIASRSSDCPLSATEVVTPKNVNIMVSYNPPKSLYTSFDQLRSPRPNCFISSITPRVNNHSKLSPGSAVKTTEIKSPEEVTGVKSPSPEAWRVSIAAGTEINWTQAKPVTLSNPVMIEQEKKFNDSVDSDLYEKVEVSPIGKNFTSTNKHQTDKTEPINCQQSTILDKHLDGSQTIQIVTKETLL